MIVALFALSAAMVIGGIAAVIQGFPFVRLESGLAMVIAGATVAAAGAVLFGLGIVAAGLRRVERAFDARRIVDAVGAMQDGVRVPVPAVLPEIPPADPAPAPLLPRRPTLSAPAVPDLPRGAALAGAGALGGFAAGSPGGPGRSEPAFDTEEAEAQAAFDPHEPELPLPGLTPVAPSHAEPAHPEPERQPDAVVPEDDLFVTSEPAFAEAPDLRPALDVVHEEERPAPPEEALLAEEALPAERAVIGRYASGGNTYVMFADGTIEAETPQGRFSFGSLDELKAFVEGGGEAGTRGAA